MVDNENIEEKRMRTLSKFTKDHWIAIAGIFSGLLIAMVIPYWETYWVQTPQLSIEINLISREISEEAGIVVQDYPELSVIGSYSRRSRGRVVRLIEEPDGTVRRVSGNKGLVAPDELREYLDAAKEELKALPDRIESAQEKVEEVRKLSPSTITLQDVSKLNLPIAPEVQLDSNAFRKNKEDPQGNSAYFSNIINQFVSAYESQLSSIEQRYAELQTNLPATERKVEMLVAELKRKKSFFRVSAVLANSGQSSISIKRPALLRIYIGTGNYVDLKMKLENYQDTAEVSAHGTRIASFISNEISTIPEDDQKLINTYWGQSVHAILFTEDILGNINASNPIAFSEGLYQKIIYDRLEGEASNKKYFSDQY